MLKISQPKTAVLTGGTGYIGRRVSKELISAGWDVIWLVRPDTFTHLHSNIQKIALISFDGNTESLHPLSGLDRDATVFVHLATSYELLDEIEKSTTLISSNICLGTQLCAYMIKNGFTRLISTESYWQFDERGSIGGNSLYAATKSAFSLMTEYFAKYHLAVLALVLYDVYGPQDYRGKIINHLISASTMDAPFPLTEGKQIVDYVHVDDVARAYVTAALNLLNNPSTPSFYRYTVRSMVSLELRDYLNIVEKTTHKLIPLQWGARPYPRHQIMMPWLPGIDRQLMGWTPTISFESGIVGLINEL